MGVAGIGNPLERPEHDTYKSDREMSICEMRGVVAQARREAERARQDTRAAVQNDLRRLAGLAPVYLPPAAYSVDTAPVGLYCRALRQVTAGLRPKPPAAQNPPPPPPPPPPPRTPRLAP